MAHPDVLIDALEDRKQLSSLIKFASKSDCNRALRFAVMRGNLGAVQLLIPEACPVHGRMPALALAASTGQGKIVDELINAPRANDKSYIALKGAVEGNHLDIVEVLIPLGNPTARAAFALRLALKSGNEGLMTQLTQRIPGIDEIFLYEVAHAEINENEGSFTLIDKLFWSTSTGARGEALKAVDPALLPRIQTLQHWLKIQQDKQQIRHSLPPAKAKPGGRNSL